MMAAAATGTYPDFITHVIWWGTAKSDEERRTKRDGRRRDALVQPVGERRVDVHLTCALVVHLRMQQS